MELVVRLDFPAVKWWCIWTEHKTSWQIIAIGDFGNASEPFRLTLIEGVLFSINNLVRARRSLWTSRYGFEVSPFPSSRTGKLFYLVAIWVYIIYISPCLRSQPATFLNPGALKSAGIRSRGKDNLSDYWGRWLEDAPLACSTSVSFVILKPR